MARDPSPPDPRDQVSYLLWQLSHALQQDMTAALAAVNLTLTQLSTLAHLARDESLSKAQLARLIGVTPQNMSLAVAKLETEGYIRQDTSVNHGRIQRLELTPLGRSAMVKGQATVKRIEIAALADFSPYEREEFPELIRRALRRLRHGPVRERARV